LDTNKIHHHQGKSYLSAFMASNLHLYNLWRDTPRTLHVHPYK
jgi:hypothetical protein